MYCLAIFPTRLRAPSDFFTRSSHKKADCADPSRGRDRVHSDTDLLKGGGVRVQPASSMELEFEPPNGRKREGLESPVIHFKPPGFSLSGVIMAIAFCAVSAWMSKIRNRKRIKRRHSFKSLFWGERTRDLESICILLFALWFDHTSSHTTATDRSIAARLFGLLTSCLALTLIEIKKV